MTRKEPMLPQEQVAKLGAILFKKGYRPCEASRNKEAFLDSIISGSDTDEPTKMGKYLSGIEGTQITFFVANDPDFPKSPKEIQDKTFLTGRKIEEFLRKQAKNFDIPMPASPIHYARRPENGIVHVNIQPFLDEPDKFDDMLQTLGRRGFLGRMTKLGAAATVATVGAVAASRGETGKREALSRHYGLKFLQGDARSKRESELRSEENFSTAIEFGGQAAFMSGAAVGAITAKSMLLPSDPYGTWDHFVASIEKNIGPLPQKTAHPARDQRQR